METLKINDRLGDDLTLETFLRGMETEVADYCF